MIDNWIEVELKDVADYINGRAFKPIEWEEKGLPIIRIQNLNNPQAKFNYTTKKFDKKYLVKNKDLLFAWSASLGAYIWSGDDAWLNQHIFKVHCKPFIKKYFLYYYLEKITKELYSKTHGSGMVHVTKSKFVSTLIPIPPLLEQRAIVSRIEELFSRLDKGIETLQKVKTQLKIYRQAVLKWAFEGKLTNSNTSFWENITLKEILSDSLIGIVKSQKEQNKAGKGVPYIKMNNIDMNGNIDTKDVVFVSVTNEEIQKYMLKKGDVLINTRNSYELVGKTGIMRDDTKVRIFNNNILRIRFKSSVNPLFICYQFLSPIIRNQMRKEKKATTNVCALYQKDIFNLKIRLANIKEQQAIVQEIETRLSVADKLEQIIDESIQKAESLRQSILKKAFEGKLLSEVEREALKNDPEWEPAEKLLERIRAEKEKLEANNNRKKRNRKN